MQTTSVKHTVDTQRAQRPGKRFRQRLLRVDADDQLPLTLKHERIYILPTYRGLAFVGVSLVMILASMNYGLNLGYALSFILIGLFASCLLSTYSNLSQLTVLSIHSEDTFAGNPVEYHVMLAEHQKKRRYSIALSATGAETAVDINTSNSSIAVLRNSDTTRGVHQLGRITLSSDFPLGLWRGWAYLHTPANTVIYPKQESPAQAFPLGRSQQTGATTATPSEREFDQLKRYEKTDSPATVAWKTVASGRGWFSKEFADTESRRELELCWNDTRDLPDTEKRLSRLCSWIINADSAALPYLIELPESRTQTALGPDHKRKCLRLLAGYKTQSE